ncbi:MAG: TrkA family potassium uptake protein [Candidatus Latescibacteria bacterium]|nr:TrkA family potassium uptake protein [Candidatus Latescibacterota bacterium]
MLKKSNSKYIIIVGCGRLGSYLANRFSHTGHSVVVIDGKTESFEKLSLHFSGFKIEGDATELQVLKQAKIDRADLLLATTERDNINLMVAQVAQKIFKVPHVMARVYIPDRENIYRDLGIETICPTTIVGDLVADLYMEGLVHDRKNEGVSG